MSTLSLHAFAEIETNATSVSSVPTRQDHGTYLDIETAPQPLGPLGPMAKGHLMTVEIRDVDLILSLIPKMNRHEVPSYYGSQDYDLDQQSMGKIQVASLQQTCQNSLQSRFCDGQTRIRDKNHMSGLRGPKKNDGIPYEIKSLLLCQNNYHGASIQIN